MSAHYTLRSCDRWLSVRLELFANVIVLISGMLLAASAWAADRTGIAGLAGFALTYAMSITGVLNWAVRTAAETGTNETCVARTHTHNHMRTSGWCAYTALTVALHRESNE